GWSVHDPGEDLVPDAVRPAVDVAVPDEVLLLRPVDDRAVRELRVRDEAAAREAGAGAEVEERREPVHVHPAHREACEAAQTSAAALQSCLPFVFTSIVRFDSERQKLTSAVHPFGSHWLYESTVPSSVTSPGERPSPATSVWYPTSKFSGAASVPY